MDASQGLVRVGVGGFDRQRGVLMGGGPGADPGLAEEIISPDWPGTS